MWHINSEFLTLIGGATSCVLCDRCKIKLFKKGVEPKLTASELPIIEFNKSKYHALISLTHLVIHKCVKVPTIIRLDVEKN